MTIIVLVFTGGRRPSPFNRRPAITANGNTEEKDSELENDEAHIENIDEEVSTESQPAFIPTPAIKVSCCYSWIY